MLTGTNRRHHRRDAAAARRRLKRSPLAHGDRLRVVADKVRRTSSRRKRSTSSFAR
jgi:hypothetical protein